MSKLICKCAERCEEGYPELFEGCEHSSPHSKEAGAPCTEILCDCVPLHWNARCIPVAVEVGDWDK